VIERLPSGIPRLDGILSGGLPANSINLVIGEPGSGKTILAQRYAFTNGTVERPALYCSTVSEPLDKIVRFGQTMSFFDVAAVGGRVLYDDLGQYLARGGLPAVLDRLETLSRERRPGVLVIDSFKALTPYATDDRDYRSFLHELAGAVSATTAASLWVGEYARDEVVTAPEFAVADSVVALGTRSFGDRSARVLEVLKLRGSDYIAGQHGYRLTDDGLDLFPRLADPRDESPYVLAAHRGPIGTALDEMVGEGYWAGAATLCAGPSGVGKTIMGLEFIVRGAARDEPGIVASLQENPTQLARVSSGFSWSLDGRIDVMYRSPVDIEIDEWVYELLDRIERLGARRVLIDSLVDLHFAARGDEVRFREYMYSLTQRCSRAGVSLFMTTELPELFDVARLSDYGVSHLADNVLLLQYRRVDGDVRRSVTLLKARATRNATQVREFTIGPDGIALGDVLGHRSPASAD
jgi:circadian clock protein KaiC